MKYRKSIAYASPTSPISRDYSEGDKGGYYVAQSLLREDGYWSPSSPIPGTSELFAAADDADLIASYRETEGAPCPMFLRHGADKALAAINGKHH